MGYKWGIPGIYNFYSQQDDMGVIPTMEQGLPSYDRFSKKHEENHEYKHI